MYGVADSLIRRMQSVQNAAAWLITEARRQGHITQVLRQLHWLPVCQRVWFKVQTGLYHVQVTIWSGPQYLVDDVQLLADSGRRLLRSANYRACVVPQTKNSFDDKAFSVAGPKIWNDLPPELRHKLWTIQKYAEIVSF